MNLWQITLLAITVIIAGIGLGFLFNFLEGRLLKKNRANQSKKAQHNDKHRDLLNEIESNLGIATQPWSVEPVPFETKTWEAYKDRLSASLREKLTKIYVDIQMANSLVWLSKGLGQKSESLNSSYTKLRDQIATALSNSFELPSRQYRSVASRRDTSSQCQPDIV